MLLVVVDWEGARTCVAVAVLVREGDSVGGVMGGTTDADDDGGGDVAAAAMADASVRAVGVFGGVVGGERAGGDATGNVHWLTPGETKGWVHRDNFVRVTIPCMRK